jgi:hypothetical protein
MGSSEGVEPRRGGVVRAEALSVGELDECVKCADLDTRKVAPEANGLRALSETHYED